MRAVSLVVNVESWLLLVCDVVKLTQDTIGEWFRLVDDVIVVCTMVNILCLHIVTIGW